jgi:hypothetical protein
MYSALTALRKQDIQRVAKAAVVTTPHLDYLPPDF